MRINRGKVSPRIGFQFHGNLLRLHCQIFSLLSIGVIKMDTQQQKGDDQQSTNPSAANFTDMVVQQYKKIKENAETYPYVWGSYIVVYGGFGLWTAYRWRKLRKTEDRVRALQERLRKLVESEESSATSVQKNPPSDKTSK